MLHHATVALIGSLTLLLLPGCGMSDSFEASEGGATTGVQDTAPVVAAVVPARGSVAGGTELQVQGRGFDAATLVRLELGGQALDDVVVVGPTLIRATTRAAAPGAATLVLEQGVDTVLLANAFTYELPPPPPAVFLADGRGGVAGNLYRIDLSTLSLETVAPLPFALTGLARGPDGALWGVEATKRGQLGDSRLVWIDPVPDPVSGNLLTRAIGVLRDVSTGRIHQSISDITFVGTRLLGWTQDGDLPCEIDTATGIVTTLDGGITTFGGGLAHDGVGTVWLAPQGSDGALQRYDPEAEVLTAGPTLTGASVENGAIGAMAWLQDALLALELSGQGVPTRTAALVGIDPVTGLITKLLDLPPGVAAIARGDS